MGKLPIFALYGLMALSVRMERYLRIRNNLFLVWGGDAPNPFHSTPPAFQAG